MIDLTSEINHQINHGTNIYISVHSWSKYDKGTCSPAQAGVWNMQRNDNRMTKR